MSEHREKFARIVRAAWVKYCLEIGDTKPSHIAPWEELSPEDKEADRRIADAVIAAYEKDALESYLSEASPEWYPTYVPGADNQFHVSDDNGGTLCRVKMDDTQPNVICDKCTEMLENSR